MAIQWQLWDKIRAYSRKANLYRSDNIYQDQSALDRIVSGGDFIDFSKQSALLEQTNLQINRLERYKDYDMMDEVGEVTLALDMYADESSLIDPERKHSILVRAKSMRVKRVIEDLLYNTLLMDRDIRPMIRYLCKYGDYPAELVPTRNRDGIASLRFMNVYNFTRIQTKFGDLVGFFYQDPTTMTPVFLHPWQVMHLRLTSFETAYHPYGRSILDGGRKDFKRLRLMEDAALIYRITRAPEKRIFSIPVGNIPPQQVPQYIELIARQMKKHKFVDPATGTINERYSPLIQDDDFFLPKRADGTGPTVETLKGAENLDQIKDIEYFKKKMVAGLKIPFSRVGIGEQSEADGRSLASVSPEFAKAIQWIQREVTIGLKKVVIAHLAMRGHTVDEIRNFDLYMTAASAIDELYRIETWNTRADIIKNLLDTDLFPRDWILENFTDMSRDEVREMQMRREEGPIGESNDRELGQMLLEMESLEKNLSGARVLDFGDTLKWYVNSKELDGLPDSSGKTMIENSVDVTEAKTLKEETLRLLTFYEGPEDSPDGESTGEPSNVISEEDVKKVSAKPLSSA